MDRAFFQRPVLEVARELVGATVMHGATGGRIVETEAYHETEAACHAHIGVTARTSTLFEAGGIVYVYRSYGIHALLNVVCEPDGVGAAVLIRALEPTAGEPQMVERRRVTRETDLCSGPGKLTQALGIGLELNASDLLGGPIRLLPRTHAPRVATGPRIGITKAADLPWRFAEAGNPHVSRPRL